MAVDEVVAIEAEDAEAVEETEAGDARSCDITCQHDLGFVTSSFQACMVLALAASYMPLENDNATGNSGISETRGFSDESKSSVIAHL